MWAKLGFGDCWINRFEEKEREQGERKGKITDGWENEQERGEKGFEGNDWEK